ncbi:helix-turn-helix domain-containing protein [Acidipila rosea]|uniref:Helix-turn-helix protein n=1 Tax=Acidipila rosea TaxID=768535 RepID=A0A4R1L485_9BACT|nr:helix-turn-helix domain-containing protein [Acidipila rosea]TCK72844.1 helix-turn-helix protein [Acidipila rosea]
MPDVNLPAYPLLEQILKLKGFSLQPMYSNREVAEIFGVSIRAIQDRIKRGGLTPRNLPGRARFLPLDLEQFLANSLKTIR